MTSSSKIVVTGAAQGIGRAVALRLAASQAYLALWDTQADGVEKTAQLCREAGAAAARAWHVDIAEPSQVESAVAAFAREWGHPNGLVNNAAVFPRARAIEMDIAEWNHVLRVNLTGTFVCARTVARGMRQEGSGVIVNLASGRALHGAANGAHYAATKAGIIGLTKSLALDWAPYGIRVNCVIPGVTDTAQPRGEMTDEQLYALGARVPLGRIGQPDDIAAAVCFLLGKDSSYMTGQSIAVNGGAIMIP